VSRNCHQSNTHWLNIHILQVGSVPSIKFFENLKAVRRRRHRDFDGSTVFGRGLVGVTTCIVMSTQSGRRCDTTPRHTWIITTSWETLAGGRFEFKRFTILVFKFIRERVEIEGASKGHGDNEIGRCDKGMGRRVGIVASCEVAVVRGNDRVRLALLDVLFT
jgi:hypothetical protein